MSWIIGILAFFGLLINLIFNVFENKELLKDNKNFGFYMLVYIVTAFVLTATCLYPEWAGSMPVFNGLVGLSLPQVALYQLTKNKFKDHEKSTAETLQKTEDDFKNYQSLTDRELKQKEAVINDLNRTQEELMNKFASSLVLYDNFFVDTYYKAGADKNCIEQIFRDKSYEYVKQGLLTEDAKIVYDTSISICINNKFILSEYMQFNDTQFDERDYPKTNSMLKQ
jgi:hypothetical protein